MGGRGFKLDPRSHALHGTTVVFGSGTSSGGGNESKLCPPRRADSRYSPLVLLEQWRITLVVVVVVVFSPKAKVENDGFPESPLTRHRVIICRQTPIFQALTRLLHSLLYVQSIALPHTLVS